MEQAGYLDLTAPQSSRLIEVDTFSPTTALAGDNILKTFTVEADEPVIRVFCCDKNSLLVKMTTYYVRQQFAEDPGRPFDLQREERAGADRTVEVWLSARTPDGRQAPESDSFCIATPAEQPWLVRGVFFLTLHIHQSPPPLFVGSAPCGRLPDMP